jgi:hypothetical protein
MILDGTIVAVAAHACPTSARRGLNETEGADKYVRERSV